MGDDSGWEGSGERGQLGLELFVLALQVVELIVELEFHARVLQRVRRQGAGEFALGGVDLLPDQLGLFGVGLQLTVLAEMVDGEDGVLDMLLVKQTGLEVRLGRIVAALGDDLEEGGERLLIAALADELLAPLEVGVGLLGGKRQAAAAFAAGGEQQRTEREQTEKMETRGHRSGKGIERCRVDPKFRIRPQRLNSKWHSTPHRFSSAPAPASALRLRPSPQRRTPSGRSLSPRSARWKPLWRRGTN
jgi:hypothetical protein